MRRRFSDLERLKKEAKDNVKSGYAAIKKWWISKYRLPPNHPLFLQQSIPELNLEMFEDHVLRRDELIEMLQSGNCDHSAVSREIGRLDEALGDGSTIEDDLFDKWERQLEDGQVPDLNEGLNGQ